MSNQTEKSQNLPQQTVAACLKRNQEDILQAWEQRIRKKVQPAGEKDSVLLRDSLLLFLEQLVESLETQSPRLTTSKDIARAHAIQRLEFTEFDLEQVMTEYNTLLQVIFQVLDSNQVALLPRERDVIIDYIQSGKMAAANRYTQLTIDRIQRGEKRFRALYELSGSGIAVIDPVTERFLQANRRFTEMLGYSEQELHGKTFSDITHSEDVVKQHRVYGDALERGVPAWKLEKRYIRKDGSMFWAEVNGTLLRDAKGVPELSMVSVEDISDRKQAEAIRSRLFEREKGARKEAEESLALLETIFSSAPVGTALFGPDLRYIQVNAALSNINGIPAGAHIGKRVKEILPEFAMEADRILTSVFQTGKPVLNQEATRVTAAGSRTHTLSNFYPITRPGGEIMAVAVMVVDITERERVEVERKHLLQSESEARARAEQAAQRLRDLMGITDTVLSRQFDLDQVLSRALEYVQRNFKSDAIVILLLDERKEYLEVCAVCGLEKALTHGPKIPRGKGIAGQVLVEERPLIIDDLRNVEVAYPALQDKGLRCLMSAPLRTKQGVIGVIHVGRMNPILFQDDDLQFLNIIADRLAIAIENAHLYENLQHKLEELKIERELRERFVATLAHDLRSPLTAARMSAGLVIRYPDRPEARERQLGKIFQSLSRADQMIENLLDANRIRAGERVPLDVAECDLRSIAQEVAEELAMTYGERFVIESPDQVPGYWSYNGIRRILENLIANGAKYGSPNTPITIRIELRGERVWVFVHNQGSPIPESEQLSIFEPFHRLAKAEGKGKQGWGLGLTLVRGLTEAHGGQVSVRSSATEGTTFKLDLPIDARSSQVRRE